MKPTIIAIFVLISLFPLKGSTQDSFQNGSIVTANDESIDLSLKFTKGKLIALTQGKTQKVYSPGEVRSFAIGTVDYISYWNDVYKEITSGNKAMLYQKVTDNSRQAMYNGTEVVGFLKTTAGKVGDYYVLLAKDAKLELINEKNFKNYFSKLCTANDSLSSKIADERLTYHQIKDVVELYNNN